MTRGGDRRRHRPPRRHRDALRPALRGQQARPRDRAVHRREPVARTATLSVEEKKALAEAGKDGSKMKIIGPDTSATMILDNLRKAGVQNTDKNERLKFDRARPLRRRVASRPTGEYTEKRRQARGGWPSASARSTAPSARELVKEAAKEAVQGVGFDLLIVCGFAFDPHVTEEAKRYGKLTVLPARMNPDLAMGDELLKKTGAGNLFMVFGEPDVEIKKAEGRQDRRRDQGRGRLRPDHRRDPQLLAPTTSPAGSSTPTTTARASSSATPTSPAPTSPTTSSSAPCGPRSTKPPGRRSTHHQPPLRPARDRQDRGQGHQPLRRRGAEGVRGEIGQIVRRLQV